jgi:hypothetical protein
MTLCANTSVGGNSSFCVQSQSNKYQQSRATDSTLSHRALNFTRSTLGYPF